MPLPFPIPRSSSYHRLPKRKVSGAVANLADLRATASSGEVAIGFENPASDETSPQKRSYYQRYGDADYLLSGVKKSVNATRPSSSSSSSSWLWFCGVCQTVDLRELAGFVVWEALVVLIVVLAVADWIFFFRFVVAPEDPNQRAQYTAAWVTFTALVVYMRQYIRSLCGAHVRSLAEHAEIFVGVSLVMVFSTNIAFFLHTPALEPLRDLGFMLIPPQDENSTWRPLSDLMTALLPIFFMIQSLLMTRENRCRVMTTFFRVATVCYALRTLTVSLTSLPGPAPHCRPGSPLYSPPSSWLDVVTRVGPMYGKFFSCGDLIFSGHMAYTNTAMLLYLRTLDRYFPRFSRPRWLLGGGYMIALAVLCISGRKHYSVDVVLGMIVSTLVFFHFEHGWLPACVQHYPEPTGRRRGGRAVTKDITIGFNGDDAVLKRIVVVDDEADEDDRTNGSRLVDFIC